MGQMRQSARNLFGIAHRNGGSWVCLHEISMPIRIDLLNEAREIAELRRPIRRALLICGLLLGLFLLWSLKLRLDIRSAQADLDGVEKKTAQIYVEMKA